MKTLSLFKQTNFSNTIWWKVKINIAGYKNETGNELVTEILKNRIFRIVETNLNEKHWLNKSRILIQCFEDGYICWVDIDDLVIEKNEINKDRLIMIDKSFIQKQIPIIMDWIQSESKKPNFYLWGGTAGPNYDCSGLIQTAFLRNKINVPRDSFQLKNFCEHLFNFPGDISSLQMGDILFFGEGKYCNHVGIYCSEGQYYHSSGRDNGRDGIALDSLLDQKNSDRVSNYYRSRLISAGRVTKSYLWNKTIR
tara:strand:+ start:206 stop:961 length:756 start_codon:yes stop_codon:yes gene_type:complete